MKQYHDMKERYPDAIIFFRMGDFYETFYDDAKVVARELNITLTSRDKAKTPLAGIPYHALDTYLSRMIKKGYRVAICEQIEDPKKAKGVVKRDVVRVVTPGTVLEDSILEGGSNNYLMAMAQEWNRYGLAFVDVSTGEFLTTQIQGDEAEQRVLSEMARFSPTEIIVSEDAGDSTILKEAEQRGTLITRHNAYSFTSEKAEDTLKRHFSVMGLDGLGLEGRGLAVSACGGALDYLFRTQKSSLDYIDTIKPYRIDDYLVLDSATIRNLELLKNIRDGGKEGSLIGVIDRTVTPMGSRLLKSWLLRPLVNREQINGRLDAVAEAAGEAIFREEMRSLLSSIRDMERLIARTVYGSANPRDLVSLRESLKVLPQIKKLLAGRKSPLFSDLNRKISELEPLVKRLDSALLDEPPVTYRDGGVIRDGYSPELDELKSAARDGKAWIAELQRRERERTGIKNLKVGFNRVFGYYIEVSKSNLGSVPEDYIRKQTLTGGERFITPELKEKEALILTAEDRMKEMEYDLFVELRKAVAGEVAAIQKNASAVSVLDAVLSLATVAVENRYVRPEILDTSEVTILNGRHPTVELILAGRFVPNDTRMDSEGNRLLIITGPNMAGKSTYMRQVALIVLMAQMGSFVPADVARLSLHDRIFTRVGAFDDLTRGQSTFMVEMTELANILHSATERSLIILDEIGRGTSTFDGLSIAWAVTEYLHSVKKGSKTLFATHYHQLTDLADKLDGAKNYSIAVKEEGRNIVFLRKIVPESTSRSYGIEVAKLAGVPIPVIERAKEVLRGLEEENVLEVRRSGRLQATLEAFARAQPQRKSEVEAILMGTDVMKMTPIEALTLLHKLKEMVEKEGD